MKHQLDHAVVAEGRQGDDFRRGSDHDPSDRGGEDCFDVHESR